MNYENYSIKELVNKASQLYEYLTYDKNPVVTPKAYILGGQSGAGKTSLHAVARRELDNNVIVINADDYRELHPNFLMIQKLYGKDAVNHTQDFANAVANLMIDKLSSDKYNLCIEGTCRRADIPLNTCESLKEKGYSVELAVICTNKEVSWQRTIDRYNIMLKLGLVPRAVPRDKHDYIVKVLPDNIGSLYQSQKFDEITLYTDENTYIYKLTEERDVNPKSIISQILNSLDTSQLKEQDEPLDLTESEGLTL